MADNPACFSNRCGTLLCFGGYFRSVKMSSREAVRLSFALQINFLSHPLLHLISYQDPKPPSSQVSSAHPTRQPRPDNHVLITRLLGWKIALIRIHMQENTPPLPPPPPPPPPCCVCVRQVYISKLLQTDTKAGGWMVAGWWLDAEAVC